MKFVMETSRWSSSSTVNECRAGTKSGKYKKNFIKALEDHNGLVLSSVSSLPL